MGVRNLKSIFRKGKPSELALGSILENNGTFWIEDMEGRVVFGERSDHGEGRQIIVEDRVLGKVFGPESVALLVQFLVDKEQEKKVLGNEVLTLYREINLIYNFSEKLSNAEDPGSIGSLALDEAHSMISADGGAVKLNSYHGMVACFGCDVSGEIMEFIDGLSSDENGNNAKASIVNDFHAQEGFENSEVHSLIFAPLKIKDTWRGFIVLTSTKPVQYTAADLKLLNTIALMAASAIERALLYQKNLEEVRARQQELERMNDLTTKFVPRQFIQALGHRRIFDVKLGDKAEREVTVFFSDIRSYSTMSERMTLSENFDFVMKYNESMGPLIDGHGGFVAQYLGDGIMALFPDSVNDAVRAAIAMQQRVNQRNAERHINIREISVGMGLHTGHLIMGVIGDPSRMDAAIISDTVNSASRMEGLCKHYGSRIVISNSTFDKLNITGEIAWRCLGKVRVKGKEDILEVYDIYEADTPEVRDLKNETKELFSLALQYYQIGRFEDATSNFARVLAIHPEDKAAQVYLNKSIQYQSLEHIPEMWSGVEEMAFK